MNSSYTETKVFQVHAGYDVHLKGKVYFALTLNGHVHHIFSGNYYSNSERRVSTYGTLGRRITKLVEDRIANNTFDEKPWENEE